MITCKKAKKEDCDLLLEIREGFLTTHKGDIYFNDKEVIDKNGKEFLSKAIGQDYFSAFLAMDGEKVVGMSAVFYSDILPAPICLNGKSANIASVYTIPEYRHQGIGKKVFSMAFEETKERNCTKITLAATKLGGVIYKKLGFVEIESKDVPMFYPNKNNK